MKKITLGILFSSIFCVHLISAADYHENRSSLESATAAANAAKANVDVLKSKASMATEKLNLARAAGEGLNDTLKESRDAAVDVAKAELEKAITDQKKVDTNPKSTSGDRNRAARKTKEAQTNVSQKEAAANAVKANKDEMFKIDPDSLKKLIEQSKDFTLEGNLSVGNEHKLELSGEDSDNNLIYKTIDLLVKTLGTLAIFLYVIGGFFIITSQGDENQLQKGKTILTYTSLGLIVAFGSYVMVSIVMSAAFNIGK